MTSAAKIVYAAAALIGLAAGLVLGFLNGSFRENLAELERIGAIAKFGEFSYGQYLHADTAHARQGLLSFASFVEQTERVAPTKTQEFDLAVTYTRLALLEDADSNAERSREYMEKALTWEKSGSGRQYAAEELKAAVRKLDLRVQSQQ